MAINVFVSNVLAANRFYHPHRSQCRIQDGRENVWLGVSTNFRPMFPKNCKKKWPGSYITVSTQIGIDTKSSAVVLGKTTISKVCRLLTFQSGIPVFYKTIPNLHVRNLKTWQEHFSSKHPVSNPKPPWLIFRTQVKHQSIIGISKAHLSVGKPEIHFLLKSERL